jgi:hypothetical protein
MIKYSEEFKQEAVRIALTSGLPRARLASDLGVGKSTLTDTPTITHCGRTAYRSKIADCSSRTSLFPPVVAELITSTLFTKVLIMYGSNPSRALEAPIMMHAFEASAPRRDNCSPILWPGTNANRIP